MLNVYSTFLYIILNVYYIYIGCEESPLSFQSLVADACTYIYINIYSQLQKCFKRCKHLYYNIFKFKNLIFRKLQKLTFYKVPVPYNHI